MDIKWLEDFICLSEQMNFSRAAEKRHITQSAFSRRIKSLESWLGVSLVNRDAYPPHLTPEGEEFRLLASETVRNLMSLRRQYHHAESDTQYKLNVATQHTISTTFIPHWLKQVKQDWGDVFVNLTADKISDCVDALTCGDVDLLFLYEHESIAFVLNEKLFPAVTVGRETLAPVSATEKGLPIFDLGTAERPTPFLSYSSDACFGCATKKLLDSLEGDTFLQAFYQNSFSHSLRVLTLEGQGVAWLPLSSIQKELNQGRVKVLGDESHQLSFGIKMYHAKERVDADLRSLLNFTSDLVAG